VKVTGVPAVRGDAGDDVNDEIVTGGRGAGIVYDTDRVASESAVVPTCRTSTFTS